MPAYQRTVAVAYAQKWCESYNPSYPSPSTFHGTDCTNFVSQCLHEGGWPQTDGSFFNRADNTKWWCGGYIGSGASYSWGAAQNLRLFLRLSNRSTIAKGILATKPGDVLFFIEAGNFAGHAAFVTEVYSNEVIVCQHTSPQNKNRKLSEWLKEKLGLKSLPAGKSLDQLINDNLAKHPKLNVEPHNIKDAIADSLNRVPRPEPGPMPR